MKNGCVHHFDAETGVEPPFRKKCGVTTVRIQPVCSVAAPFSSHVWAEFESCQTAWIFGLHMGFDWVSVRTLSELSGRTTFGLDRVLIGHAQKLEIAPYRAGDLYRHFARVHSWMGRPIYFFVGLFPVFIYVFLFSQKKICFSFFSVFFFPVFHFFSMFPFTKMNKF